MKSKFMRMVGSGIEDENEDEPQVFQEYEEQPKGEVFQEYEEEPEEKKILPLISDAEIDAIYIKFNEVGFKSDATDRRGYVLDAYIRMKTFVSNSNIDNKLEGSGRVEDLNNQISQLEIRKNEIATELGPDAIERMDKPIEEDEELSELRPKKEQQKITQLRIEYNDIKKKISNLYTELKIEKTKQKPDDETKLLAQARSNLNDILKINNQLKTETNNKQITQLRKTLKERRDDTNEIYSKFEKEFGLNKEKIDNLVLNFAPQLSLNERFKNIFIQGIKYPIHPEYESYYDDLTADMIFSQIKQFGDTLKVNTYMDDLYSSLTNTGVIKGDVSGVNQDEKTKKKIFLEALNLTEVNLFDLDEKCFLNLPDEVWKKAYNEQVEFTAKVRATIPQIKQYSKDLKSFDGFSTQYLESKFLKNEMADYYWNFYKNDKDFNEKIFKTALINHFENVTHNMTLRYNAIFGDASPIDHIIKVPIKPFKKDNDGNYIKTKDVLIETKSSEKGEIKEKFQDEDEPDENINVVEVVGEDTVYTTTKKLFGMMIHALNQDKQVAFCNFHSLRIGYADEIVNSKSKDCLPNYVFCTELFSLFTRQNFKITYEKEERDNKGNIKKGKQAKIFITDNEKNRKIDYEEKEVLKKDKDGKQMKDPTTGKNLYETKRNTKYKEQYIITKKNKKDIGNFLNYFYGEGITSTSTLNFNYNILKDNNKLKGTVPALIKYKFDDVMKARKQFKITQPKPVIQIDINKEQQKPLVTNNKKQTIEDVIANLNYTKSKQDNKEEPKEKPKRGRPRKTEAEEINL